MYFTNLKNISCKEDFCWQNKSSSGQSYVSFWLSLKIFVPSVSPFMHTKQESKVKWFLIVMLSDFSFETTDTLKSLLLHSVGSYTVVLRISALMFFKWLKMWL